jgi:CRISPR/Cas system CSM-associated protein Csm3 (group 7 of RAMP superfamily)
MNYQVITAEIVTRTALHMGSGKANSATDALIRRDAAGKPVIPGTSLGGSLRALLTRLAPRLGHAPCLRLADPASQETCTCPVCNLLGSYNPTDNPGAQAHGSQLIVYNACLVGDAASLIRDGVGIHRSRGSAAKGVKYDLELLPANARFELRMELRSDSETNWQLLAAALAEWQAGRGWLGGRVGRGLGAFKLEGLTRKFYPLNSAANLVSFIQEPKPWRNLAQPDPGWLAEILKKLTPTPPCTESWGTETAQRYTLFTGTLQAEGPLLTHDTQAAGISGFDHAPLLSQNAEWQAPVLTGAGLRGVLRSHAERILRTVASQEALHASQADPGAWFLQHCPACNPVESQVSQPLPACDALLKDAQIDSETEVADEQLCLACRLFGSTRRGSRLIVEDAPYYHPQNQPPQYKMLDFLAIDRFTGGGADAFKFDALALWKPAFSLRIFVENPARWELALLFLVLRDLESGWLQVGMGASKGFGKVKLQALTCQLGYLHDQDLDGWGIPLSGQRRDSLYSELILSQAHAAPWLSKLKAEITQAGRLPAPKRDSYFGEEMLAQLYPIVLRKVAS